MNIQDISNLQIGNEIELPTGARAVVKAVNPTGRLVTLSMSGGSSTVGFVTGEIPPEKLDAVTTIVCGWTDLSGAIRV